MSQKLLTLPSKRNLRLKIAASFDILFKFPVIAFLILVSVETNAQKTMNFAACPTAAATLLSSTATTGDAVYTFLSTDCEVNATGFTVESVGTGNLRSLIAISDGNQYLRTDRSADATFSYGRLSAPANSTFSLSSISVIAVTSNVSQQITLSAYKSGSLKGTVSKSFTANSNVFLAFTSTNLGTAFANIDEIRASSDCSACNGIGLDDITFTSSPLPVELILFTGADVENKNTLKWNTVQEVNTEAFILERSQDAKTFVAVGSVSAANAPGNQEYEFTDPSEQRIKNLYYRLKMVDKDESYAYSRMIVITRQDNLKDNFVLFPNPLSSSDAVSLKAGFTSLEGLDISILDESGRESRHQQIGADDINDGQVTIHTNGLPAGTYFFKIHDQKTEITDILRLEKQ